MIKLGLIGCGKWGKNYLKNLTSIEGCELSWVCDLDLEKLKEVASIYPQLKYTQNIADILVDNEIKGVVIATSPESHYRLAKEFLSKGKSVLVEKPVTMDLNESIALTNLATKQKSILMAGYTLMYHPAIKKIKKFLQENNEKGKEYYLNMSRTNSLWQISGVDVLHDLAVHDIYLSRYLFDEEPNWVIAQGANYCDGTNNDVIYILLGFPNGKIASIFASFIHSKKTRKITLIASKIKLVFDDMEPGDKKILLFSHESSKDHLIMEEQLEPLKLECLHFVECIRENKEPHSGKADINFVAKITDFVAESLAKGGEKVIIPEGSKDL